MDSTAFWGVMVSVPVKVHACCLHGMLLNPDEGNSKFL
jgi:hypothetical protein